MSAQSMDVVPEDDIDLDTLQAKIDLSMSLTHDLVTSWMTPTDRAKLQFSSSDTQKLMEEQMRRPPRLGVGAPIPESSNSLRETSRLKYQLQGKGKKREREEEGPTTNARGQSDDEEESKVGLIRKKIKVDPFAVGAGKKKKKKSQDQPANGMSIQHSLQSLPTASKTKVDAASEQIHSIPSESSTIPGEHTTPRTKKKKTVKKDMSVDQVDSELKMKASPIHTPLPLPTPHISRQTLGTHLNTLTPTEIKLPSSPMSSHTSFGKHSANGVAATSSKANSRVSATDDASSSTLSRPSQSPSLNHSSPSIPLPPHLRGSLPDQLDSMTGDSPSSKSKKKRKRRKKKKMQRDGQAHND